MSEFYTKYFKLVSDEDVKMLLNCIKYREEDGSVDFLESKFAISKLTEKKPKVLERTRIDILCYLYFVWLEGIRDGPEEWWCEMVSALKRLVMVATALESLNAIAVSYRGETRMRSNKMDISQVLLKLWDYIKTQEETNGWSYIDLKYDKLYQKHNDLRELFYI